MSDVAGAADAEVHTPNIDAEAKARRLGWVPKDEFKGDPERWRSAEDYVDRGESLLPILQGDNRKLHKKVDELETTLKETREATKELLEFTSKAEQRSYERAKTEIQARIEAAAANADPNAVRTEMQALDVLNRDHAPKQPEKKRDDQQRPAVDPVIQDWIDKEPWFTRDKTLNVYAGEVYGELERTKPGVSASDLLAETKRRTMDKFPEKFGINPAREGAATVATPSGGAAPRKRGKTYDDLPAEAKQACDKFVKTIPGYKREDYVKDYEWES